MPERNVAIVIFYDKKGNIIVQERGRASKVGEKYGFFGGQIERDEIPEQAVRRELKEELGFVPRRIDFWGNYSFVISEKGPYFSWQINCAIFVSPITSELKQASVREGKRMVEMEIDKVIKGDGFPIDSTKFMSKIKKELVKLDEQSEIL